MKRAVVALIAVPFVVAGIPAADADTPELGVSYSAAATVTPGPGIVATVSPPGGALGGLLDFVSPVLNQVVTPLTAQLTSLPGTVVSALATGLGDAGYSANSPSSPLSPPASGYPGCTSNGFSSDTCYGPLVPTVSAGSVLSAGTGTLQGYAAADSTGSYAKARAAGIMLTLLGIPIGNLGVAEASAQCLTSSTCNGHASLTGLSLLGGVVAAQSGDDGTLQISLNGGSFAPLSSLSSPVSVNGAGVSATVQAQGGLVKLTVGLGLDQLLGALGIADVLDSLGATVNSSIALTVTIGAGSSSSGAGATASGLEVGLGLSGSISLNVLGLVTLTVSAPDNTTTGDLVDLHLAYATATPGNQSDSSGAPPDLT